MRDCYIKMFMKYQKKKIKKIIKRRLKQNTTKTKHKLTKHEKNNKKKITHTHVGMWTKLVTLLIVKFYLHSQSFHLVHWCFIIFWIVVHNARHKHKRRYDIRNDIARNSNQLSNKIKAQTSNSQC